MRRDFIHAMQVRTARCAIGASTLRRQGAPRAVENARAFLAELGLKPFGVSRQALFVARLDAETARLQKALPRGARGWGTARKALNIFLRDAAYNDFLRARFALDRCEPLLEIPLDSITAKHLREAAKPERLPRWPGVSRLTQEINEAYQQAAYRAAKRAGIDRVHLDVCWWGGNRKNSPGALLWKAGASNRSTRQAPKRNVGSKRKSVAPQADSVR